MYLTDLRNAFWVNHPEFQPERRTKKRQNDYSADIRTAWVNFVDAMQKEGRITEKEAFNATL